jgi:peptide/nickel transport system permease protein
MLVTLFFGRRRRWRQAQLPALAQLSPPPAAQAWRRLRRHRPAMISLALLVLLALLCLIGPSLSPWRDDAGDVLNINQAPSGAHWLGTDFLGRDICTRLLLAGRISLTIGLVSMLLSVTLGYVLGALSGYLGGVADRLIMRFADLLMTIPGLPLLIIMGAMLTELDVSPDYRIYMVMIMLSLLGWPSLARLVRGQILSLRERDFMLVATMAVANAILSESALSYLGLGVVPPTPSWGNMMDAANSLIDFQRRPWLWMPPGLAIFVTVVAINILGDGLRDALDPKMNGVTR